MTLMVNTISHCNTSLYKITITYRIRYIYDKVYLVRSVEQGSVSMLTRLVLRGDGGETDRKET